MERDIDGRSLGIGVLLGVVAGVAAGLLFAPQSGRETREKIGERFHEIKEKVGEMRGKVKELRAQGEQAGQQVGAQAAHRAAGARRRVFRAVHARKSLRWTGRGQTGVPRRPERTESHESPDRFRGLAGVSTGARSPRRTRARTPP